MHKIEIKISLCIGLLCFLFIFFIFCISKEQELSDFTIKKHELLNQKSNISKLSDDIAECSFGFAKPSCLNCNKLDDCKNIIKEICKESHLENVLFKITLTDDQYFNMKNVEIKFSTKYERSVYNFIIALQKKLNEVIIFDVIKIIKKDKHNFVAKILFRLLSFGKSIYKKSIIINPLLANVFSDIRSICLFPTDEELKKYTLYCVIENSQAYINDVWMNIGDVCDNFKVKNIYQNSIDIQRENEIINVNIGYDW